MKFLTTLKSWQLFMLFAVCIIFSGSFSVAFIGWILYTAWVYHIGVTTHHMLSVSNKPGIKYFQFNCLFIPFIVGLIILLSIVILLLNIHIPQPTTTIDDVIKWLLVGYGFWCYLYISMYAGRMLESVIQGELVNRSDAMKAFVCFLVFPIGVWYIQPAFKKVVAQS